MEKFVLLLCFHFVTHVSGGAIPVMRTGALPVPGAPSYFGGYFPNFMPSPPPAPPPNPPPPPSRCRALNQTTLSLLVGGGTRASVLSTNMNISSTYFNVTPTLQGNESVYIYRKWCYSSVPTAVSFSVYCTGGSKPATLYYNNILIGIGNPTMLFGGVAHPVLGCNLIKLWYFAPTTCAAVMKNTRCTGTGTGTTCSSIEESLADTITAADVASFTAAATNGTDISLGDFIPGCQG